MTVELIRHGETESCREHRYPGSTNEPLSSEGRRALVPCERPAGKVYVSPALRTVQTAEILFPRAERIPVPGLEEMDFGVFAGRTAQEMEDDAAYRAWVESGCLTRCPEGERKESFCNRVCTAFAALLNDALAQGEETLLVVVHGGTVMAVMERYGRPEKDYFAWHLSCGHGIRCDASRWQAERVLTVLSETDHTDAGRRRAS